ncbi:MAG: Crp/Fnr family transcriptional regulator [Eggerthellaceae bacterium]|nr:Crp/Fnr family transcriptional regulator [Eggerthellaceae bacterium]
MMGCLQPHVRTFRKGSYLLRQGDAVSSLGMVLSGSVLIRSEDYWGNGNILARSGPGSLFAEAFACMPNAMSTVDVVAGEKTEAIFMDVARIISTCPSACAHHTRLIRNLTSVLAQRNYALTQKMGHLTKRTTREKVLSYLSSRSQDVGSSRFTIPFDRQQLADYLSVDRSALSSCLGALKREGIIDFRKNSFELM